jgi:hypothetical protein
MIVDRLDRRTVRSALELAGHAPSVHNSQPWQWRVGDRSIHLYADLSRWLPVTDADGRDLLVSLGAALHHARVALAAAGLGTTVHRFPNPDELDHVAALEVAPAFPGAEDLALAAAIPRRRSDRRPYADWDVPEQLLGELVSRAADEGTILRPITAARTRFTAAVATAADIHAATPGYATETMLWTARAASDDGVPAANLPSRPQAGGTNRHFPAGTLDATAPGGTDGGLLTVLGTASDDRLSQLRAGEALSAVALHATVAGLASCPLSEVLEVDAARAVLRDDVLRGTLSPQLVLRLGFAPAGHLPATPRRPVDSLLDDLSGGPR